MFNVKAFKMAHNLKSCLNRRSSLVLYDLYSVLISAPSQLSCPILPTLASAEIAHDNDRVNPLAGSRTSTQDYLWLEWGCGPEPHSKLAFLSVIGSYVLCCALQSFSADLRAGFDRRLYRWHHHGPHGKGQLPVSSSHALKECWTVTCWFKWESQ